MADNEQGENYMKRIVKIMFYLMIAGVLLLIMIGINIKYFGSNAKPSRSDCIIILGCQVYGTVPSPFLKSRLEEGLRLYNEGYGNLIIVSGGQGPGEDISEAEAMKNFLVSKGVSPGSIIMEDKSFSTLENIKFSGRKMSQYGIKSAVVVSNKYHLKRASLMAKKTGIEGSYSGVYVENHKYHEISGFLREILALLKYYIILS